MKYLVCKDILSYLDSWLLVSLWINCSGPAAATSKQNMKWREHFKGSRPSILSCVGFWIFVKFLQKLSRIASHGVRSCDKKMRSNNVSLYFNVFSGGFRGGCPRRAPRPKIFSISYSFSQNLAKSYVGAPSYGESWIRPWDSHKK